MIMIIHWKPGLGIISWCGLFRWPEIIRLFHWLERGVKHTHLPCFRQGHFFLQTYIFTLFIAYLYSTCYNKHVHVKILKIWWIPRKLYIFMIMTSHDCFMDWYNLQIVFNTSVWPYAARLTLIARWFWWRYEKVGV